MPRKYESIINLPAYKSKRHPEMNLNDRAKIFLPFAALKGYDDLIESKSEVFDHRIELAEDKKIEIEKTLNFLNECQNKPDVSLTYFIPNKQGKGGRYTTVTASFDKIDSLGRSICIQGLWIDFDEIIDLVICE